MSDSQKRREELLKESRRYYREDQIPAIHPRYRAVYRGLYSDYGTDSMSGSSLGTRIFISLVLFVVFASADYNGEKIWHYTPSQIAAEIQSQTDFTEYLP